MVRGGGDLIAAKKIYFWQLRVKVYKVKDICRIAILILTAEEML